MASLVAEAAESSGPGHWGEGDAAALTFRLRGLLIEGEDAGGRRLHAHRNLLRSDDDARTHALQAVHDDELAWLNAITHDSQAVDDGTQLDGAVLDLVVRTDREHVAHALVRAD